MLKALSAHLIKLSLKTQCILPSTIRKFEHWLIIMHNKKPTNIGLSSSLNLVIHNPIRRNPHGNIAFLWNVAFDDCFLFCELHTKLSNYTLLLFSNDSKVLVDLYINSAGKSDRVLRFLLVSLSCTCLIFVIDNLFNWG